MLAWGCAYRARVAMQEFTSWGRGSHTKTERVRVGGSTALRRRLGKRMILREKREKGARNRCDGHGWWEGAGTIERCAWRLTSVHRSARAQTTRHTSIRLLRLLPCRGNTRARDSALAHTRPPLVQSCPSLRTTPPGCQTRVGARRRSPPRCTQLAAVECGSGTQPQCPPSFLPVQRTAC